MNSQFVRLRAEAFSARLEKEAGVDPSSRIRLAYQLAFSRLPGDEELASAQTFLNEQLTAYGEREDRDKMIWADLCQALLSSNEFLYVR